MKQEVVSSRFTRSRVSPDWTVQEMLVLVGEIAAIESEFMNTLSSYQKWKIIADNCTALGVVRSLNQCRNKWKTMLAEYKLIKDWETSQFGIDVYWSLESETKMEHGLPLFFDRELFRSIEHHVKAQEGLSATDTDSDLDLNSLTDSAKVVEIQEAKRKISGTRKKRRMQSNQRGKIAEREQEMAMKLQENLVLIHSIIRGDFTKDDNCGFTDWRGTGAYWTQLRRWQGSELIKVLGSLVGSLDQLSVLIKECR